MILCYQVNNYSTGMFERVNDYMMMLPEKSTDPSSLSMAGGSVWQYPGGYTSGPVKINPGRTTYSSGNGHG